MCNQHKRGAWLLFLAALAVAAFLSPFASRNPDGLDRVAEDYRFAERGRAAIRSPLPEYTIPGVSHAGLSTALAGIVGTLTTVGVGWGIAIAVLRRRPER